MAHSSEGDSQTQPDLPDFCSSRAVLAVVLISALVAAVLTLADRGPRSGFLLALSTTTLFMLWLGLTSAAVLCRSRHWLAGLGRKRGHIVSFIMLILISMLISECGWWLNARYANFHLTDLIHSEFLLRNTVIAAIVIGMTLRYFYVTAEWRRNVELEALARIRALQARIRPHFLFNSMNTIADLTRSNPARAEEAIEDLADLFRATLGESQYRIPLKEELEVARIYQRMEQLRLGDRLEVDWQVASLPMQVRIPGLTVQPLLENAIYHGIEPLAKGGVITVTGCRLDDRRIELTIRNPIASASQRSNYKRGKKGNQVALDNIRQRFDLAYGGRASVDLEESADEYFVRLRFPEDDREDHRNDHRNGDRGSS